MRRARDRRRQSISTRLTVMNLMVGVTAIVLTASAMMVVDWITFREGMVRALSIQAKIIGNNAAAAIVIDDPGAAAAALSALSASPEVNFAAVVGSDGTVLATYRRVSPAGLPPIPKTGVDTPETSVFSAGRLRVSRRVELDGEAVGTVFIWSDLSTLAARMRLHVGIVVAVAIVSFVITTLVSTIVRRSVSEPIVQLAEVARSVSERKDYSRRASTRAGGGEVAVLSDAFNEMLERVEAHDAELERAREELELRVEERTAQLESANKELEAFSYSVSHDLRAPLRHMDGYSSLLEKRYRESLDPAARRYLSLIRDSAQQMGHLIDDLLSLARISRRRVSHERVDLNELVQTVREEIAVEARGRNIEWIVAPLPEAACDPGLMTIVFTNLLANALKYTRGREVAVIEIGCTQGAAGDVFMIRDNGAGFDQAYAHKLFGVFQRLHHDEEFEGTGVGLATVQRILHAHGGRIWAEGAVDGGARFYFTLADDAHAANPREAAAAEVQL